MSAPVASPGFAPFTWLPLLLETLVAADPEPGPEPVAPVLLRIELEDGAVTLGARDLDLGEHPADALLGFVAPEEWVAFGIIATGWGSPYCEEHRARRGASRVRVRTAHVVARDGNEASALSMAGEPVRTLGLYRATDPDALAGSVPDIVRRVMNVPTAPAGFPPSELMATVWLSGVTIEARRRPGHRLTSADIDNIEPGGAEATQLLVDHPDELTWESLRWMVVRGTEMFGIDPTLAAWFDDGAFARWALGGYPPVADQLRDLAPLVTGKAMRAIRARLRRWGVL